jgi:carboxypeptidase Taq
MSNAYKTAEKLFAHIAHLERAKAVLHWDMAAMMPVGGAEARAEQLATLSHTVQILLTDDGVDELLDSAEKEVSSPWQKANVFEMKQRYVHAKAVPSALLKELVKVGSACEMVWREARPANDFKRFATYLKPVLKLVREVSEAKAAALSLSPYDALLDTYDAGNRRAWIDPLFAQLEEFLPGFIPEVLENQRTRNAVLLKNSAKIEQQEKVARKLMEVLGFDMKAGRLDKSAHPFCGGYPGDVRITTRYDEARPLMSLMGVVHETGHALYEQGLPAQWSVQPVGEARGMSVHESQSLFWEMQMVRSPAFAVYLAPLLQEAFADDSWTKEALYATMTHVEPSLIRVDADEVTYPAHILLRYRLEQFLLSGDMEVDDLPDAWAQGMQKYLGITPPDDRDGCMQDIHWTDGSFGYFPCYALGAMMAAQLADTLLASKPEVVGDLRVGKCGEILQWLRGCVHNKASSLSTQDLIEQATGKPLSVTVYTNYLRAKYLQKF